MKFLPATVINFHAINCKSWFEKTLLWLSNLYQIVSVYELDDFYYDKVKMKHGCHLTFDDGHCSFYDIVYPLLLKYRIPASIYISPVATLKNENFWFQEIIDYDEETLKAIVLQIAGSSNMEGNFPTDISSKALLKKMPLDVIWESIEYYQKSTNTYPKKGMNLTIDQVNEINASGLVTIGAHTLRHPILANETDEAATREILDSITNLSEILGKEVMYFAYPNGQPGLDFGTREKRILSNSPVRLAFSTKSKKVSISDDRFAVPRNGISKGGMAFITLKLVAGSNWPQVKKLLYGKQESDIRLKAKL